ncbi:MAG: hypothetical protein O7C75_11335 [Verrucomicrobia bacterium]|nr:hypothetical protein [Verrucomicrobiota bacterium]
MATILKHWYVFALALVLSLASALGLIYLRKDAWMPSGNTVKKAEPVSEAGPLASQSFREWEFSAAELENLRIQLEGEKETLRKKEDELQRLEGQIRSEVADLNVLRRELETLRQDIHKDIIVIDDNERQNLRSLSSLYAEMKAPAAVKVLGELKIDTVVKILSLMPSDAAARILGTLADLPGEDSAEKAAEITEAIRNLKK